MLPQHSNCTQISESRMHVVPDDRFDVFLSHAHTDAEAVEALATRLEDEAALRVWLDKWILVPGEHWRQAMAKGLDGAKTCAVCIGQHTPRGWFREEIGRAINRQTKDSSFRVIPVILPGGDHTKVDDFLELRTWARFEQGISDKRAFHYLVSGITGVAPGRGPVEIESDESNMRSVREGLTKIRDLRQERLIDEDIAQDYQRKLLNLLFEP